MFSNNFFLFVLVSVIVLAVGGMYFAYIISQPASKQSVDPRGLSQSDDPLVNARAEFIQKLQDIVKPISTRYLVFCQEKRDENGYIDSSLSRFEQDCEILFSDWKRETQLCNSHYLLKKIYKKFELRLVALCEEQATHLEAIASFPSRNEKNVSIA